MSLLIAKKKLLMAQGGGLDVSKVFATKTYTGNGATQTIVNGIDLSGASGGAVWFKKRSADENHSIIDTARGRNFGLRTNTTGSQVNLFYSGADHAITSFNSNGFSIGDYTEMNQNGFSYVTWTFAQEDHFFKMATFTHTNGVTSYVDLSSLGVVGFAVVKCMDSTSNWFAWHKAVPANLGLRLNSNSAWLSGEDYVLVSGTTLSFRASMPSGTYVVHAWAHDESEDGIVKAGAFMSGTTTTVDVPIGWQPQFIMVKLADATGHWMMFDTTRTPGFVGNDAYVMANSNLQESPSPGDYVEMIANGVRFRNPGNGWLGYLNNFIYLAIRAPA